MQKYPLQWPVGYKRSKESIDSRFGTWNKKPTVSAAAYELSEEFRRMNVTDYIISSNLKLRNDGLPRSTQKRPEDTAIAVYFTYKGKQNVIACDTYNKCGCNIHAIVKTVSALRSIERWGCSEFLERAFTGFEAIPERTESNPAYTSPWAYMGLDNSAQPSDVKHRYKVMCKTHHPDSKEGSEKSFIELRRAYEFIMNQF